MEIASLCITVIPADFRKPLSGLIGMTESSRVNLIELLEGCWCVCANVLGNVKQFYNPDHWCYSRLDASSHVYRAVEGDCDTEVKKNWKLTG